MKQDDLQAASRPRVFLGFLVIAVLLTALVLGVQALRHPFPDGLENAELSTDDSDPRVPVVCEQAAPREGQDRENLGEDAGVPAPTTTTADGGAAVDPSTETARGLVTSGLLYQCPETYDGMTVRYEGEVVGAVLEREDGAWVQLNDDIYAGMRGPLPTHRDYRGGNAGVGVFISPEAAAQIDWVGGPDRRGDVLLVEGTFHRVDEISAEVAIIRADAVRIAEPGSFLEEAQLPARRVAALVAAVVAIAVTVAERLVARRRG